MKNTLITLLKIIAYAIAVFIVELTLMGMSMMIFGNWVSALVSNGSDILKEGFFLLISVAIVNAFVIYMYKSNLIRSGWPDIKTSVRWFLKGSLLGLITALVMIALTILSGGGYIAIQNFNPGSYLSVILPLLGILFIAALAEEWFFRGFPFALLSKTLGKGWTNILFALLFALAHFNSAGWSIIVFINIVIGGLILGALRFTKGGIPAAWGFHFIWNSIVMMTGSTLTGEELIVPGISFVPGDKIIFSGGELGPEGGIGATISTIALLISIFFYLKRRNKSDILIPKISFVKTNKH